MRIVLFGASGNIGRQIAREGAERGHAVIGVVRDAARAAPPGTTAVSVPGAMTPDQAAEAAASVPAIPAS